MRTETWTCDRCGATGDGSPPLNLRLYGYGDRDSVDLCSDCLATFVAWATAPPRIFKCKARRCKGGFE